MSIRSKRKWDHLKHAIDLPSGPKPTGFDEVYLVHQALSSLDLNKINTETSFLGRKLKFPLLINALTGGAPGLENINKKLALTAQKCGIALAIGSQTAAIEEPLLVNTYKIVRDVNPEGVILANVSATVDWQTALAAIEMVQADGLQLHLNLAQELVMNEGERNFEQLIKNICEIKEKATVPVIIKEVGFGLASETVKELSNLGIKYYDIGGAGGTNFISIENRRKEIVDNEDLLDWGIPTVISLIETLETLDYPGTKATVCASGGVYSPANILKSLVLGANIVGIAAPFLKNAYYQDVNNCIEYTNEIINRVKMLMLLVGASDLEALKAKPIIITGRTREWLEVRGINVTKYASRSK